MEYEQINLPWDKTETPEITHFVSLYKGENIIPTRNNRHFIQSNNKTKHVFEFEKHLREKFTRIIVSIPESTPISPVLKINELFRFENHEQMWMALKHVEKNGKLVGYTLPMVSPINLRQNLVIETGYKSDVTIESYYLSDSESQKFNEQCPFEAIMRYKFLTFTGENTIPMEQFGETAAISVKVLCNSGEKIQKANFGKMTMISTKHPLYNNLNQNRQVYIPEEHLTNFEAFVLQCPRPNFSTCYHYLDVHTNGKYLLTRNTDKTLHLRIPDASATTKVTVMVEYIGRLKWGMFVEKNPFERPVGPKRLCVQLKDEGYYELGLSSEEKTKIYKKIIKEKDIIDKQFNETLKKERVNKLGNFPVVNLEKDTVEYLL